MGKNWGDTPSATLKFVSSRTTGAHLNQIWHKAFLGNRSHSFSRGSNDDFKSICLSNHSLALNHGIAQACL